MACSPPTTSTGAGGAAGAGGAVGGTTAGAAKVSGLGSTGTAGAAMRASVTNDEEDKNNVVLALSITGKRGRNNLKHTVILGH